MRVNQRGAATIAHILNGFLADGVAFQRIGAVAFRDVQAGKAADEFGNAATGGLYFDRHGNGVAVVFNQIKQRKLLGARGVQRFPEFALAGGAIAGGDINDFVRVVIEHFAQRRFLRLQQGFRMALVIERSFRGAHRLHELRSGAGRLADDIPLAVAPVRRHLAAAGAWIVFGADGLQQHVERSYAEHQAESAIAIIGVKPIDSGTKKQAGRGSNRFMAGAGDLKENFVLALELDFAVVQPAGEKHRAVQADERVAVEALMLGALPAWRL